MFQLETNYLVLTDASSLLLNNCVKDAFCCHGEDDDLFQKIKIAKLIKYPEIPEVTKIGLITVQNTIETWRDGDQLSSS